MKPTIAAGSTYQFSYRIPENKTVPHVFEESELFRAMPKVFATAFMVGLVEWACMEALREHLEPGEQTLGTAVNLSHTAPTPPGLLVTVLLEVASVEGRCIRFKVRVEDEQELVGEGTHERFVIQRERFLDRVAKKAGRSAKSSG